MRFYYLSKLLTKTTVFKFNGFTIAFSTHPPTHPHPPPPHTHTKNPGSAYAPCLPPATPFSSTMAVSGLKLQWWWFSKKRRRKLNELVCLLRFQVAFTLVILIGPRKKVDWKFGAWVLLPAALGFKVLQVLGEYVLDWVSYHLRGCIICFVPQEKESQVVVIFYSSS